MDDSSASETFSKKTYLVRLIAFLPVAALAILAAPVTRIGVMMAIVVLLAAASYAILLLTSEVTFDSDGSLRQARTSLYPNDAGVCKYHTILAAGRWPNVCVLALYRRSRNSYQLRPDIMVWTLGWHKVERRRLFSRLDSWLTGSSAVVEDAALRRIRGLSK